MRKSGRREGVVVLLALLAGCAGGGSSSIEPGDSTTVVSGEPVRTVGVEPVAVYGHGRAIAAHVDADGALVGVTSTGIHRVDTAGGEIGTPLLFEPGSRPERAVFSADGHEVAVLVDDSHSVLAYATDSGEPTRSWSAPDGATIHDLWFEPTGGQLVLETSSGPVLVDVGAAGGTEFGAVQPTGRLDALPDGTIIGAVLDSAELLLIRSDASERRPIALADGERAEDLHVSPDGSVIGVSVPSSDDEFEQVHRVVLLDASLAVRGTVATGLQLDARTWTLANDRIVVAQEAGLTAWSTDGRELGRAEMSAPVVDMHPIGDEVVIIGRDGSIARWDGESAPEPLAAASVTTVFASVDADRGSVTTVDLFGRIDARSLTDGSQLRSEDAFAVGGLTSLAVSDDDSTIAVGSTTGQVTVLDTDLVSTHALPAAPYGGLVDAVAFDPRSGGLVTGLAERVGSEAFDDTVTSWSTEYTERFRALGGAEDIPGCAFFNAELHFDPSGALLVAATHDFGVAVIDAATGEVLDELPGSATVVDLAFTADGSMLVVTHDDGVVDVWDAVERTLSASYRPAQPAVGALVTVPGTDHMVVADLTGALSVLDVLTGATIRVLDGVTTRTRALAISPDGAIVAAPQPDGTIGLWSTSSGAQIGAAAGHHGAPTALAFDASGSRLYSASDDGTVRSWAVLVGA